MDAVKFALLFLLSAVHLIAGTEWCNLQGSYTDPNTKPGYRGDEFHMCKSCPVGTYHPTGHTLECTPCPEGTTTFYSASTNEEACTKCERGHIEKDGVCEACPVGTFLRYRQSTGTMTCQECFGRRDDKRITTPGPATMSSDDCGCQEGYRTYFDSTTAGGCTACGKGEYSDSVSMKCKKCPEYHTTNQTKSTTKEDCICEAGTYFHTSTNYCSKCGFGSYSEGSASSCTECPPDSTTLSETSTSVSECVCKAGYFTNAFTGECVRCPEDNYSDSPNSSLCSKCPSGLKPSEDRTKCEK